MVSTIASMYYFYNWEINSCCLKNTDNFPPENMGWSWCDQFHAVWFLKKFFSIQFNLVQQLFVVHLHCAWCYGSKLHETSSDRLKIFTPVKERLKTTLLTVKSVINKIWKPGGRIDKGDFLLELSLEDRVRIHHSKEGKEGQARRCLFPPYLCT